MFKRLQRSPSPLLDSSANRLNDALRLPASYWVKYLIGLAGLGLALTLAWNAYGVGAREEVEKVLVISDHPDLHAQWLAGERFGPERQDTFAAQGRTLDNAAALGDDDDQRQGLDAVLHHADREGFGLVAWRLADPHRHPERRAQELRELQALPHARESTMPGEHSHWVVLTVGELSDPPIWTLGQADAGIEFAGEAGSRTALLRALHLQPELAARRTREALVPHGGADFAAPELAAANHRERDPAAEPIVPWRDQDYAARSSETIRRWREKLGHEVLAAPLQQALAYPLADGTLMFARRPLVWQSHDGTHLELAPSQSPDPSDLGFVFTFDDLLEPSASQAKGTTLSCEGLDLAHAVRFALSPPGDALVLESAAGGTETYQLDRQIGARCRWILQYRTQHDPSMDGLGVPYVHGATAGVQHQRLWWRKGSSRYSTGEFAGALRPGVEWLRTNWLIALVEIATPNPATLETRLVLQALDWHHQESPPAQPWTPSALAANLAGARFEDFVVVDENRVLLHLSRANHHELGMLTLPAKMPTQAGKSSRPTYKTLSIIDNAATQLRLGSDRRWLVWLVRESSETTAVWRLDLSQANATPTKLVEIDGKVDEPRWLPNSQEVVVRRKHSAFGQRQPQDHRFRADAALALNPDVSQKAQDRGTNDRRN